MIAETLVAAALACHPLNGDRILGRDLAAAAPAFSAIDPDLVIGASPIPGVRRIVNPQELLRIAHANKIGLPTPAPQLCFERATELLTAARILPVLQKSAGIEGATIQILDFTRTGVPPGTLEFPRSGLNSNGVWCGHVTYSENRTIPVWARVRITTQQHWIEVTASVPAGKTLAANQLTLRTGPRNPLGPAPLDSIEAAVDHQTLRTLNPGEPLFAFMLIAPHDVERGQKVSVDVSAGEAHITFEAVAESSGRAGESILVRNPLNDRYFQARIDSKGKVSIHK